MRSNDISRRSFVSLAGVAAGVTLASVSLPLLSGRTRGLAQADEAAQGERIVILHTNDVHCAFTNADTDLGYAAFVDYATQQRETYGQDLVAVVDAGDNFQGAPAATATQGQAPAQVIAGCGYDVMTCGNHEFDYGFDRFLELYEGQGVPYVCCNLLNADGTRVFDAYRVLEFPTSAGAARIAFVGVLTPITPKWAPFNNFKDENGADKYTFCGDESGQLLYDAVQAAVDEARDEGGADYVVLLAHLGQKGIDEQWRSDTVVANTTGVDIVIDGHSHEQYVQTAPNKDGELVVITQTGTKFQSFGRIEIDPAQGTATASLDASGIDASLITQASGQDEAVAELVEQVEGEAQDKINAVVGTTEVFLRACEDDGQTWAARLHETNLGDLYADALLRAVADHGMTCDLAVANSGSMRANLEPGDVTYGGLIALNPFANQLVCLEVSGQHILDMLEVGVMSLPDPSLAFLQVCQGVSYKVRTNIPTPVVLTEDGSKVDKIEGERRVTKAQIAGQDIDPKASYVIAANNFVLLNGGYCMPIPENASDASLVCNDMDAMLSYITDTLGGTVGQEYADEAGQGRIEMLG